MAKFIPHKVQITAVDGGGRDQTDHFMQSYTPFHHKIVIIFLHMPIHVGIDKTENDRLVTHQRLVMTFRIADCLFVSTAVRRLPPDGRRMPVFVFLFFDRLDPVIGDIHCHTVVEAITAIFIFGSQSGHSAYFFGNRNRILIDFVDKLISQRQIRNSITILMTIKIISIITKCFAQSVTVIKHRGHAIETETVEFILVQPEFAVRQQKMKHFILSIVETKGIPCRMLATGTAQKILRVRSIETSEAFYFVLDSMTMYDIHNHSNPHTMSLVYQLFQFFRRTKTGRCGKKTADMITERTIIRMFLNSHNLNGIISFLRNTGQHHTTEFVVTANFLFIRSHTDMTFINQQWRDIRLKPFMLEHIRFLRIPYLRAENFGIFILNDTPYPCRNTFPAASFPLD